MKQEKTKILEHRPLQGDYRVLTLSAPMIGPLVRPGQFLGLRVPRLNEAVLRRPFSIFKADSETVTILYKVVGKGTRAMADLKKDWIVDILGPLGNGFPVVEQDKLPVLVGGGYGAAALYLQAKMLPQKGVVFFGGRNAIDILCVGEFEDLDWEVCIATEDGSLGSKGLVTDVFDRWYAERSVSGDAEGSADSARNIELFACGPQGMLRAMGDRADAGDFKAWLSIDRHMACGVGVCLTCVVKKNDPNGGWQWARCCKDGPVFESREILWDE
ncbi:MAG: dihydroorotate dehydrogenase electron transfer subunit [Proteobacteria bacterium]|nr:dihydroorotate dehydrogenase electron transfer subunit [Pseudomonadota bacterium]